MGWQSGIPEALRRSPSAERQKASLDLANQCERLFANGTSINSAVATAGEMNSNIGTTVNTANLIKDENYFATPGPIASHQKGKEGASRLTSPTAPLSTSIKALLHVAYPKLVSHRSSAVSYIRLQNHIEEQRWIGAVVDGVLVVYVGGQYGSSTSENTADMKGSLVALLDLATECLECDRVVIALDKLLPDLSSQIRNFYWVGFEMIKLGKSQLSDAWIAMDMQL